MRQSGVIAAGALFALRNNRLRLAEDHRRLEYLRSRLVEAAGKRVEVMPVSRPTNILYFRVGDLDGDVFAAALAQKGVLMFHLGGGWVRAVTHLHIDDSAIEHAANVILKLL